MVVGNDVITRGAGAKSESECVVVSSAKLFATEGGKFGVVGLPAGRTF